MKRVKTYLKKFNYKMLRVVFFGTPHFVVPILQSLADNFHVVGIVTAPDQKVGRKQILTPSPVKVAYESYIADYEKHSFQNHKPQIFTPQQLNHETIEQLNNLNPDLFIVAAYGKLIPKNILSIPKKGAINIHPSILPKYRGPSPIQETILQGDTQSGISFMVMDEELDHGPILHIEPFPIKPDDTFETLSTTMFAKAAELLPNIIEQWVDKSIPPTPQNHEKATYTKHIEKNDGYFTWENPPPKEQLNRMIRAYYPWPGAWTLLRLKASNSATATMDKSEGQAQQKVVKFLPDNKIQVEGKKPMSYKDFINGYPEMREFITKLS